MILNCAYDVAGTCHGGSASGTYEFGTTNPIPFETCQVYTATDGTCTPMNICRTCWVSRAPISVGGKRSIVVEVCCQ